MRSWVIALFIASMCFLTGTFIVLEALFIYRLLKFYRAAFIIYFYRFKLTITNIINLSRKFIICF